MALRNPPPAIGRSLAFVLVVALGTAPALAKPTVIAELGTAPLLGTSSSTKQLRDRVARNEGVLSAAGVRLGLTPVQYAQFRAAIDSSRLAWVTVPRHLDAMTWQGGGRVYVIRNVIIPARTHGWEVDIPAGRSVLALYMPATCGNLSILRKNAPVVAARPTRVAALRPAPVPVQTAPPAPVVAVVPPPAPVVVEPPPAPVVAPTPVAVAESEFPPAPAAAKHGVPLFPLLFGLAAFFGGGTPSSDGTAPIYACP